MNDAQRNPQLDGIISELRSKAERARRHARSLGDSMALTSYAGQLEAEATKLEGE